MNRRNVSYFLGQKKFIINDRLAEFISPTSWFKPGPAFVLYLFFCKFMEALTDDSNSNTVDIYTIIY